MKTVMLVFGTRPDAVKMCPLLLELRSRDHFNTVALVTGQHRDMLDGVLRAFGVTPDYDLGVMREEQSLFDVTSAVMDGTRRVLSSVRPDAVLVHGDTTTAFAAALACFYENIPVCHVEAGLRTYDVRSPYPEEFNRRAVSLISRYDFAPTELARDNLIKEGKCAEDVFVTGNTVVDALHYTLRDEYTHPCLEWASGSRAVLLTMHRRESLGEPMREALRAVRAVAEAREDVKVIFPVHRNPAVRTAAHSVLDGCERVLLTEPLDVVDFHNIMARAHLILTDSGSVQEESAALGKPTIVLRDKTERQEGVASGVLLPVGTDFSSVTDALCDLFDNVGLYARMSAAKNPFGNGEACRKIADVLDKIL